MQKYANCLLTNFQVFVLHYDLLSAVEMHYKIAENSTRIINLFLFRCRQRQKQRLRLRLRLRLRQR